MSWVVMETVKNVLRKIIGTALKIKNGHPYVRVM